MRVASAGAIKWVKFTGDKPECIGDSATSVWISTRGQSDLIHRYSVYIDDFVITDVTDAAEAQQTANANVTAISSLQAKTSDLDGKNHGADQPTDVDAVEGRRVFLKVDQLSKTISDSQITPGIVEHQSSAQIDAQASANIKNRADLNSATTKAPRLSNRLRRLRRLRLAQWQKRRLT